MKITSSPWGLVQSQKELAPGIVQVETASHGGIYLDPERYAQMPAPMKTTGYSANGWYEEDCDWALVALQFPDAFDVRALACAKALVGRYIRPEVYAVSEQAKRDAARTTD